MNYTVEKLENSQIKFNFTVDKVAYEAAVMAVYAKTKHKYSVPGFRKGHAPKKVIESMYGEGVFFTDAVNELIDNSVEELDKSGEYEFVSFDSVGDVDVPEEGGVKYSVTMTVKPEVKLGVYKGLSIPKKVAKVTAKQVEEYIDAQRDKQARLVDSNAEAKVGDTVNFDFVGSVNGEKFEGGSAENFDLTLGSNQFIPGFEDQLVGVKAGEQKDVNVTFPEDYGAENLAGKAATFACTVHAVKVKQLPDFNDDFVKEISEDLNTVAEYKAYVKDLLVKQAEDEAERKFEDDIVEKVVANTELTVPASMIRQEAEDMLREFEARLSYQGIKLEDYFKYTGADRETVLKDYETTAERSVRTRLIMEAIVNAEDIKIEDKDIDERIEQMASDAAVTVEEFRKTLTHERLNYIVNAVLSKKLMDMLKENNREEKKPKAAKSENEDNVPETTKPAKKSAKPKNDAE